MYIGCLYLFLILPEIPSFILETLENPYFLKPIYDQVVS